VDYEGGYGGIVNFSTLFLVFVLFLIVLLFLFRNSITSLLDPLLPFVAWAASVTSAGIYVFFLQPSFGFFLKFVFSMFCLILALAFFLRRRGTLAPGTTARAGPRPREIRMGDWVLFWVLLTANAVVLWLSYREVLSAGLDSMFSGRYYLAEEFRNPLVKIINVVGRPLFYAQTARIVLLSANPGHRLVALVLLFVNVVATFLIGTRAAVLLVAGTFGAALVLYRAVVPVPAWARSLKGLLAFVSVFLAMMVVATAGVLDLAPGTAFVAVIQRVLLAADGIFMLADKRIESFFPPSFATLLNYIFGQFFGTLDKNFGWQLFEEFVGRSFPIAVGPNFILPFQLHLAGFAAPLWFLLAVFVTVFLRNQVPSYNTLDSCKIVAVLFAFQHLQDPEYAAFVFGFLGVFFVVLYCLRKLILAAVRPREALEGSK
jgi:hypothetical protein